MSKIIILFLIFFCANSVIASEQQKAAKIIVYKANRKMELLDNNSKILKTYKIALGANPKGHKAEEGDKKTPEGLYKISEKNSNSSFHLSLRISYPNEQDIAKASRQGVSAGGNIMIHGLRNGMGWLGSIHLLYDTWTNGCIAVTNREIEEIWDLVKEGTPIYIRP